MSASPHQIYSGKKLIPSHNPDLARTIAVTLQEGTYKAGTLIGQVTSGPTNNVQTLTIANTPTHSTVTLTLPDEGATELTFVQDVTPAAMATAINAVLGAGSVTVTGTANASYVITFVGAPYAGRPIDTMTVSAVFVGGSSPTIANVSSPAGVGPVGSWGAYASGNTDGTQYPRAVLAYGVVVDDLGFTRGIGEYGQAYPNGTAYNRGQFYTADLVGLDTTALTNQPGWRLLDGSVTSGELELP